MRPICSPQRERPVVWWLGVVALGLVTACQPPATDESGTRREAEASDSTAVQAVVRRFGERLQRVSLLGPPLEVIGAIRREYGELVAPALLEKWAGDPGSAPGRLTSSPWPDHIQVESVVRVADHDYLVRGDVVERSSADAPGHSASRIPVNLRVARVDERWLIVGYEARSADPELEANQSADGAVAVVRAYYRAINEKRHADAYRLWESGGVASGQSYEEFRSGFSETEAVELTIVEPGRLEGAAGSRYVSVPVRLAATLGNGTHQEFTGTYTLRRSVVDGATPARQAWHIHAAKLVRTK